MEKKLNQVIEALKAKEIPFEWDVTEEDDLIGIVIVGKSADIYVSESARGYISIAYDFPFSEVDYYAIEDVEEAIKFIVEAVND